MISVWGDKQGTDWKTTGKGFENEKNWSAPSNPADLVRKPIVRLQVTDRSSQNIFFFWWLTIDHRLIRGLKQEEQEERKMQCVLFILIKHGQMIASPWSQTAQPAKCCQLDVAGLRALACWRSGAQERLLIDSSLKNLQWRSSGSDYEMPEWKADKE